MTIADREGRIPLHYAALDNRASDAAELIAAGQDPNARDRLGFTPLHYAVQEGGLEVAAVLLENGAQVDSVNEFGNTPLFVAVFNSRGRGDLIELLRRHGADPLRANMNGQTPVGLARLIGNYDVAKFFDDVS